MTISVVIPCYNSEKTLEECINSVLLQTVPVTEILIIDDGSKDNSVEIVHKIISENADIRIRLFQQENSGPSKARNLGIKNAIGSWIAFLDSDDIWFPTKIEIQINFVKKYPKISLVSTANSKLFLQKNIEYSFITFEKSLFKNYFETSTVMVKTTVIRQFLFYEPQKYSEDYRAWLTILSNGNQGLYINKFLTRSIDNKATFGVSGLSQNIYGIEKGEWANFKFLYRTNKISLIQFCFAITYSTLKFFRRFLITKFR